MNTLIFTLSLSAVFSLTSLLIVLFRVSPLTSEIPALTGLYLSVLLSITTAGTLLLYSLWRFIPWHHWDAGRLLSISFRQSAFLAIATVIMIAFFLHNLLNWWVGIMIYSVFLLVEIALDL